MLVDLDELISQCPDPRSREYIRESVQCYKAGAYRSAVVSCWIAVAFDLVDKIREIAASGDAMAQQTISTFDQARRDGNVGAALAFEKDVLTVARDKFEFISHIEYIDLKRLVDDRNRCAHPSLVSDTEVFAASPELARLHIVNAVRYVLSHPAAQGKRALDRLCVELDSNFFPTKRKDLVVFLRAGPLARPRESLLRNYLSILLKRLLKDADVTFERKSKTANALFAIAEMHPEPWKRHVRDLLAEQIPALQDDAQLAKAADFIGTTSGAELWEYVGEAGRVRLTTFVENLPADFMEGLADLLKAEALPLYAAALLRAKRATAAELFDTPWFDTPTPVIDRLLLLYQNVHSFASANEFAGRLRFSLIDSEQPQKHFDRLVQIAVNNDQVRRSNQFPILLKEFVDHKSINSEYVTQALRDSGLEEVLDHFIPF